METIARRLGTSIHSSSVKLFMRFLPQLTANAAALVVTGRGGGWEGTGGCMGDADGGSLWHALLDGTIIRDGHACSSAALCAAYS